MLDESKADSLYKWSGQSLMEERLLGGLTFIWKNVNSTMCSCGLQNINPCLQSIFLAFSDSISLIMPSIWPLTEAPTYLGKIFIVWSHSFRHFITGSRNHQRLHKPPQIYPELLFNDMNIWGIISEIFILLPAVFIIRRVKSRGPIVRLPMCYFWLYHLLFVCPW